MQPKFETNVSYGTVPIATGGSDERIDRLEKILFKLMDKFDNKPEAKFNRKDPSCSYCGKIGHLEINVLKRRNTILVVNQRTYIEIL